MNQSRTKTLLALWLARQDSEVHLRSHDESALAEILAQLSSHLNNWEAIAPDLMAIIQRNPALKEAFDEISPHLDEMENEELLELMPSQTEGEVKRINSRNVQMYDAVGSSAQSESSIILTQLLLQLRENISSKRSETELQFEALASEWQAAMAGSSFMAEKTSHPAYQKIIEMGSAAVPLLLRELERKPTHWFAALKAITGANPVKPEQRGRIKQMAEAWIEWGRKQGYEW
ncbi:hypothetical protein [Laspinema olomoucense]|uniref:hypothetical protein n=1 Tax=Laspinema olomoucense TaxID=3231600 RepID=UPI0021BB2325|nr:MULTISPECIES: hypothetical protein [unclassified Laspinema]MCT7975852.1 hypothetical protein [Laspinema sp. D3d]MCT7996590.1 hypothetical protein [Laspinema sp. D3c]